MKPTTNDQQPTTNSDLLLEIGTEEIPSNEFSKLIESLNWALEDVQDRYRLDFINGDAVKIYTTPRRIALYIKSFPEKQTPLVKAEIKGPPVNIAFKAGKPTKAAEGFAKNQGVKIKDLVVKKTDKGEYLFAVIQEEGKDAITLLPEVLSFLIRSIKFSKTMRWQDDFRFIRPIRWLMALYGNKIIPFELNGIKSSNQTYGHRFLSKSPIKIARAQDYVKTMAKAFVVVDQEKRAEEIKKSTQNQAKKIKAYVNFKDSRLQKTFKEVVNLVEYPHAIVCEFSNDFLSLPRKVIETVLQSHQRYFPIQSKGKLINKFVVIHNGNPQYDALIKKGHERVVRARLADGKFFFDEDSKKSLDERVPLLKGVVYQEKLGTMYEKTQRLMVLSSALSRKFRLSKEQEKEAKRAAFLSKADLLSLMVNEFAELQGAIGVEYALAQDEKAQTAAALFEQYLPRAFGDILPKTEIGKVLSIADKVDNIVGAYSIGITPTSAGDPYALRRQATSVVSVIFESGHHFSIKQLLEKSFDLFQKNIADLKSKEQTIAQIKELLINKAEWLLSNLALNYDIIRATLNPESDDLADIYLRAKALDELRKEDAFEDLITAFTRCKNLANLKIGTRINKNLLHEKEEKILYEQFEKASNQAKKALEKREYKKGLNALAALRRTIDKFFDVVLVMAKETKLRNNRLAILNAYVAACGNFADLDKIVK